ncbi:MAG: PAS domain-containing sensor histidine kinase [Bacteroidota bacterium]|nr:PAS domain-containing sensor histidine kinase [Bacteroidota bacterium]
MSSQNKTTEQLEDEIVKLKKSEENYKEIAQALNQERDLYDDLANALPSGIYRLRVFHGLSLLEDKWYSVDEAPYVVEFVNDRFCEILSLDKHLFKTNPGIINNLIFEADKAEFVRKNVEANLHTIPFIWEGRFVVKGKIIWIHLESIPRLLENKDIIWTGTLNDVSERRDAEQVIKLKNEELQKINAEKDKFFSIIAHDLKSPFSSIIGFSKILVEQVNKKNFENVEKFSEIIRSSSERAMNLLVNLMEWSLSQTGRMNFNPQYFEMNDIVNEIVNLFTNIAVQKSLIISTYMLSEMPVCADKAMINTILRNLVSNAIKFTEPGGMITILGEADQNNVKISISDTGVGMSQPTIEKLFQIGTNQSTPGTQNEIGTGLGLILCKEFIKKHHGEIWVESEIGKGSVFYFTIPYFYAE